MYLDQDLGEVDRSRGRFRGADAVRDEDAADADDANVVRLLEQLVLHNHVERRAFVGGADSDGAATAGDVDESFVSVGLAGGLVERGAQRGAVGDGLKLAGVEVVEEHVVADDGVERGGGGGGVNQGVQHGVGWNQDGDGGARQDLRRHARPLAERGEGGVAGMRC